jgi:hypothetical protein
MTTHLPIKTNFCAEELEVLPGVTLFLDGNSKITLANGTYAEPKPNAFSLPAASVEREAWHVTHTPPACPGSTSVCRASCYVKGLAQHAPDLYAKYEANAEALQYILDLSHDTFARSARALGQWISANAPAGFRWHVSGDVQDEYHAMWIVEVCASAPYTPFWIYTRTLDAVRTLVRAKNLAVNLSADDENIDRVRGVHARYPTTRITYLQSKEGPPPHLPPGSVIFPDYPIRGRALPDPTTHPQWSAWTQAQRAMVCPTDFFGQSEAHRCGPCRKCL